MRRRRLRRKSKRRLFLAATVLTALIFAIIRTDRAVRPVAAMQAEHYANALANEIISKAVSDYIDENQFAYGDFAAVLYDENGNAVSVEAIPASINRVQSELTMNINKRLTNVKEDTKIPIGSLTGSYMLVGKGPYIKLRICPAAKASVELKSSFTSSGLNQTCHKISALVCAELKSSVPIYSFETKVSFEFLLTESVLIGEVPEISRYAWSNIGST